MSDCGCNLKVKTINFGTKQCWSLGSAPGLNPFVFTSAEGLGGLCPLISQLRSSLMNENGTASFESQAFFQLSEDGITWGSPVVIDAAFVQGGNTAGTSVWYSATTNYLRFIRFGVYAAASAGSIVQLANVSLVIDILLK